MIDNLSNNTRLLLACAISTAIFLLWDKFFIEPVRVEQEAAKTYEAAKVSTTPEEVKEDAYKLLPREEIISESAQQDLRVKFENSMIKGSINLHGARLDDLILKNYYTEVGGTKNVVLFSPIQSKEVYFAEFGWVKAGNENIDLPDSKTIWSVTKGSSKDGELPELYWVNKQGVRFELELKLDEAYMFIAKQKVINKSGKEVKVSPYASLARFNNDIASGNIVVHQGVIGVFDGKLKEISFEDLTKEENQQLKEKLGWLGFSDKYWLAALIPGAIDVGHTRLAHKLVHGHHHFQSSFVGHPLAIRSGEESISETRLFAGAKNLDIIDKYEKEYDIQLFDRAIDFGVLYFMTRPLLLLLHYFYGFIGNFGVAILLLTVLIKLLLFPLAHKGYKGMNRLKDLQPKMTALKEKFADNSSAFQQGLMELYRKEKVNPMAGCLPIILQIPVFFALYKVLYVSLEMRHAAFFWWIKDLSAPDPTTIFNLFGLLPVTPPSFLMVGVLPLLMAITMYWQQKLNPEPADPNQALVMKLMPWVLLFMFASFPSGLVLYWAWSNILSIVQQLLIRKLEAL